jgi:hypothetical protein
MKRCFKCGVTQSLDDFYKHSQMADGHLNKCKTCTQVDVVLRYYDKHESVAEYERRRSRDPRRKTKTKQYKLKSKTLHPEKYKARYTLTNAVRDKRVTRQPCRICGNKAQAHHHDYSKPLDVDWLCFKHHREHAHGQITS